MVTLEQFKSYLRIDIDDEDSLLQQFIGNAISYLSGAVSNYETNYNAYADFADKADLLTMVLAAEFYQNRDNSDHSLSYTIHSLMVQLQYYHNTDSDSDTSMTDKEETP